MKYRYIVVHSTYQIENNEQTRFGIAVVSDEGESITILETISDLTSSFESVERLVKLCNKEKLEFVHLNDIVEDFLANIE